MLQDLIESKVKHYLIQNLIIYSPNLTFLQKSNLLAGLKKIEMIEHMRITLNYFR